MLSYIFLRFVVHVSRQRVDENCLSQSTLLVEVLDLERSFVPVHNRHVDVKDNHVEEIRFFSRYDLNSLQTIFSQDHLKMAFKVLLISS
jgi:hypothetical protein